MLAQPIATAHADEIRIAVAANFIAPLRRIATEFEQQTGHRVLLSPGSTGKHYAQIRNGAPFDVFFAADQKRPELLDELRLTVAGSRYTYALGRLMLWSADAGMVDNNGAVLGSESYRFLAIANPRLAPYGAAAQSALEQLGLWEQLQSRLVRGENIAQTFQFVSSGNAELGLVARSQVVYPGSGGSAWLVPAELHTPIRQQAVLLSNSDAAAEFIKFARSAAAGDIIRAYGYELPAGNEQSSNAISGQGNID